MTRKVKYIIGAFVLLLSYNVQAQKMNPNYDAALAEKVGADDYGMKSYMLVLLKTGSNTSENKSHRDSCFAGHMANMEVMVEANQLVVAGPTGQNDQEMRGIFILNVETKEEAEAILQTDPAIKANYLRAELIPWYGSAALSEYLEASDKVWKKGF